MPVDDVRLPESVLEPPASLERISAFLNDVTHTSAFESLTDGGPPPIGIAGIGAQSMATEVMGRANFGGLLPIQKDRNALAEKYSIQSRDVREFSQWLVKYRTQHVEGENVIRVHVVERVVQGPERIVQGPSRDLTQDELEALIQKAGTRKSTSPPIVEPKEKIATPASTRDLRDQKGSSTQESKEAVGFLNRGVWGSNLGFGSFLGGMAFATPGVGAPMMGAGVGYMMHGLGGGAAGVGGMAAYHGMPGAVALARGVPYGVGPARMGGLPPMIFDTAPGPNGMGLAPSPIASIAGSMSLNPALVPTPQLGQVTLVAPPLQVASQEAERSGTGVAFEWSNLAAGAAPVDERSLALMRDVLPEGTAFVYPALTPGQLPPGAVNLNLTPSLSRQMLAAGYGVEDPVLATQSSGLALASTGGFGSATTLAGSIVPLSPPLHSGPGILPTENTTTGMLAEAGSGMARRGGALDFLGMPVRLAPSLGGTSEVRHEHDIRMSMSDPTRPTVVRPEQFDPLRHHLFSAFQSVDAEPDRAAWERAAPSFGLRDTDPATLLSPDARIKMPNPGAPLPQTDGSSDSIGRSIGMASMAADSLKDVQAAKAGDAFGTLGSTATPSAMSFGTGSPSFSTADIPNLPPPSGSAGYGGSAMQSFSGMAGPAGGFEAGPVGSAPASSGGYSVPAGPMAFSLPATPSAMPSWGSSGSGGIRSYPSAAQTESGGPARPSATPPHLPMLSSIRPTPISFQQTGGPAAIPSMFSSPPSSDGGRPATTRSNSGFQPSGSPIRPSMSSSEANQNPARSTAMTPQHASSPMPSASPAPPTFGTPPAMSMSSSAPASHAEQEPHEMKAPVLPEMPLGRGLGSMPTPPSFMNLPSSQRMMPLRYPPENLPVPAGNAVQASTSRQNVPSQEQHHDARGEAGRSNEIGNTATDVNLVAREVWSLLKLRIAHEAERHGLR